MLFKVTISGQRSPRSIDIGKNSCVLGRGKECDIEINEDLISRKHIKISMEDNTLYVEEMGSSNGSWLNSQKLVVGKKTAYKNGDVIYLGKPTASVSITIENLVSQKSAAHSDNEKTLVFSISNQTQQHIQATSTKLVADGSPTASPAPAPQMPKPSMKIVENINEHKHGLEDKVKNIINQEAEKLREIALIDSVKIIEKAIMRQKKFFTKQELKWPT